MRTSFYFFYSLKESYLSRSFFEKSVFRSYLVDLNFPPTISLGWMPSEVVGYRDERTRVSDVCPCPSPYPRFSDMPLSEPVSVSVWISNTTQLKNDQIQNSNHGPKCQFIIYVVNLSKNSLIKVNCFFDEITKSFLLPIWCRNNVLSKG